MLTREVARLAPVLTALGTQSLETCDDCYAVQRKMYVAGICELDLGYMFGWDRYGPISRTLWAHLAGYITHRSEADTVAAKLTFTEQAKSKIARVLAIISVPSDLAAPMDVWLESLCAVHFLAEHKDRTDAAFRCSYTHCDDDLPPELHEQLQATKPHLRPYLTCHVHAWQRMKAFIPAYENVRA